METIAVESLRGVASQRSKPSRCMRMWAATRKLSDMTPGTDLSVIAWATSSTPTGPYAYRGILMCGSSTEWTNQASVIDMTTDAGNRRLVMIYHTGERRNTARRRIHAECLYYYQGATAGAGKFVVTKRTTNGFAAGTCRVRSP